MLVGIVGKPSAGKSTLLNALCLTDAKMGNYPFTTIKANRGVALVRVACPCADLENTCEPRTGECVNGTRYVPVEMLDVAGLVPGASEGKGMGNQFLDDIRQADALIHVVDASGTTDQEGNLVDDYDPTNDIDWLNKELEAWIFHILFDNWKKASRRLEQDPTKAAALMTERLTGLGATELKIKKAIRDADLMTSNPRKWSLEEQEAVTHQLRFLLFPMVIAANKMDMSNAEKHITKMQETYSDLAIIPTSGLAELTLRKADEAGVINYELGSSDVTFLVENPEDNKQGKIVKAIKERLLDTKGTTGVTELLEFAVFDLLELIPVYPVENQTRYTDQDGRILPDVFLVPKGTTAKEFAGKIHSDLEDNFVNAILVTEKNKAISADHELNHGDIVKINAST